MCIAQPQKIVKIKGQNADIQGNGHTHIVNISLLDKPKVGDWVMAHADLAIQKLSAQQAKEIMDLSTKINHG